MDSKTKTTQKQLQSALRTLSPPRPPPASSDEDDQHKKHESVLQNSGYTVQETIGTGAFSNVMKAFSRTHQQTVAVKVISKQKASKDVLTKFLPREIELVTKLKHVNLIRYHECIETTLRYYIVMQFAEKGSLLQLIRKEKYLAEERARSFFSQLINAVEYIHSMGVVHRDIKCENIVFDGNFTLKLIDFGFARGNMQPVTVGSKIKPVLSKTFCGSHAYASPEILKSIPYQPQLSDIWAIGVVLYTMVFGQLPFSNVNNVNVLIKQVTAGPNFPKDRCVSDECKELIKKIMRPAADRVSIEEMRSLPWLTEDDSGYDESSQEKKMKLETANGGTTAAVTISNKQNGTAHAGILDNNNNDNSSGNNGSSHGSNLQSPLRELKRKKAVPT